MILRLSQLPYSSSSSCGKSKWYKVTCGWIPACPSIASKKQFSRTIRNHCKQIYINFICSSQPDSALTVLNKFVNEVIVILQTLWIHWSSAIWRSKRERSMLSDASEKDTKLILHVSLNFQVNCEFLRGMSLDHEIENL